MLQIHAHVRARRHRPKRRPQLHIVHPDFDVRPVEEEVQPARVVEVEVADDDFADVGDAVAGCFDGGVELVLRFVADAGEDVGDLWAWESRLRSQRLLSYIGVE